jgi:hypothetical protein
MTEFTMVLIRTREGVRRDLEDWDGHLINFGYEECEGVDSVRLASQDLDRAKHEAEHHWSALALHPCRPEG